MTYAQRAKEILDLVFKLEGDISKEYLALGPRLLELDAMLSRSNNFGSRDEAAQAADEYRRKSPRYYILKSDVRSDVGAAKIAVSNLYRSCLMLGEYKDA